MSNMLVSGSCDSHLQSLALCLVPLVDSAPPSSNGVDRVWILLLLLAPVDLCLQNLYDRYVSLIYM